MVGTGAIIAELLIILMKEGIEMAQVQRDLAAGRITEDQARTRLRATQDKYAATRRAWDQAGQEEP